MSAGEGARPSARWGYWWRLYRELVRGYLAIEFAYRAEALIWLFRGLVVPLVTLAAWLAVAEGGEVQGYAPADFVRYFLALVAVERITMEWSGHALEREILTGEFSTKLLRPIHPVHALAANHLAYKAVEVGSYLVAWPFLHRALGGSPYALDPAHLALFALAALLGWGIRFAIGYAIGLLAFQTARVGAIYRLSDLVGLLLSGALAPLDLFPPAFAALARALPFAYAVSLPIEILTGRLSPAEAGPRIALQGAWLVLFGMAAALLWRWGVRRHQAVGG